MKPARSLNNDGQFTPLASQFQGAGIGHDPVDHRRAQVVPESLLDEALLAALDGVVAHDAPEQRQPRGQHTRNDGSPPAHSVGGKPHRQRHQQDQDRHRHRGARIPGQHRQRTGQQGQDQGPQQDGPAGHGLDKIIGQQIVQHRGVDHNSRADTAEGRGAQVHQTRSAETEQDMLVAQGVGIHRGLSAFQEAQLRLDNGRRAVGGIHGGRPTESQHHRAAVHGQGLQRLALTHQPGSHAQGRNGHLFSGSQQAGPPEHSIAVGHLAHVGQEPGVFGHLANGLVQTPGLFALGLNTQEPRSHEPAIAGDGLPQGLVVQNPEPRGLGEQHIEGHRPGTGAGAEVDDGDIDFARPGPGQPIFQFTPVQAGLVQQDQHDVIGMLAGPGQGAHPPAPGGVFPAVQPVGRPENQGQSGSSGPDHQPVSW